MKGLARKIGRRGGLDWSPGAGERLAQVPAFVRPLVRRKVEERVRERGGAIVSLADFERAEARFRSLTADRPAREVEEMMPRPNLPGTGMVVLQACRSQALGCPNQLLDLSPWQEALEAWLASPELNERLRSRVGEDKILFHHKLKISLSACPNGCSRPQIADLGLRARVRPSFELTDCTGCGQCAEVCPDRAIELEAGRPLWRAEACQGCLGCAQACPAGCVSLSEPGMELLAGGKLGRHPHLAEPAGLFQDPEELVSFLGRVLDRYLQEAAPGQRFADFWIQDQTRRI